MAKRKNSNRKSVVKDFLPESAGGTPAAQMDDSGDQDIPFTKSSTSTNDRRIANCAEARDLYTRLYLENQLRAQAFAQIRNQMEGGRPFDPDILHANGEDWRTNCNFNDARSAYRRVSMPYWKMVHEVPQTISVKIHGRSPDYDRYAQIMASNFDRFRDDWGPDYFLQFSGFAGDYVLYGPAHVMWEDEMKPRYTWMPSIQVLLPKRTKSNVEKWELFCYRQEITATELIKHVKTTDAMSAAETLGWNPKMIHRAIRMAAPGPANSSYFDPNYWQDMVANNDLVIGGVWPLIAVVHMWAVNLESKKIRRYMFTEKSDVPGYLFEGDESEKDFRRVMGTAFCDFGSQGLYHSIKGFGVINYYYSTVINRTKCRAVDGATFAMGMNFTKGDETPEQVPPVENYSIVNLFPPGLTQINGTTVGLQAGREIIEMLENSQTENNFTYNEPQKDIAETDTARQATILANIANEMSTASAAIFLSQMGTNIFSEIVRRLVRKSDDPDAVKFKKRCEEMGCPAELWKMLEDGRVEMTVKCGASPTMASPVAREQISRTLMTDIYPLPDSNKRAITDFRVSTLAGADGVERFMLPPGQDSAPRSRREAIMENVDMAQGVPLGAPPGLGVDPSDSHIEHIDEHLKPLEAIVQQIHAKKPVDHGHLVAAQMTLPHIAQHLNYLSTNMVERPQFKQLKARYTAVDSVIQGLVKRLSAVMQKAQATGQQPTPADVQAAINSGGQ